MPDRLKYPASKVNFINKKWKNRYAALRNKHLVKNYSKSAPDLRTQICVLHIGGRGSPGYSLKFILGKHSEFICIEADLNESDAATADFHKYLKNMRSQGCKTTMIEACIGGYCGKANFNINEAETSSSLLPTGSKAKKLVSVQHGYWADHAATKKVVTLDLETLDSLREQEKIPKVHFLNMDIQGAEGVTLQGAESCLQTDLLGVTLEIEMFPIYEGQQLFGDTFATLDKNGFLFCGFIQKFQQWHPYAIIGRGRTIVCEAFYIKDFEYLVKAIEDPMELTIQLMRLARIAFCSEYDSHGFEVLNYITQKHPDCVREISGVPYIADQLALWNAVNARIGCWPKLEHLDI